MLRCNNGNYYTGYTSDLIHRYQAHLNGRGAKYRRSFKPIEIAQAWRVFTDKSIAMKIEAFIKVLSKAEKEALISDPSRLVKFFGDETISVSKQIVAK